MARILVVDDARTMLFYVQKALEPAGHSVEVADRPSLALDLAGLAELDLVISDVNMPEMSGFELCRKIRELPGREELPFLFMSAADPTAELEIARSLGSARLLLKPFAIDELLRAVGVALGSARAERGPVASLLARLLGRLAADRASGLLTTAEGKVRKRFVLKEGRLLFASSNDPRDLIGQALLRAGVISEQDLLEGFAGGSGEVARPALHSVLASLRKLTPEQCDKAFEEKVRESLLEVFLWEGGSLEWIPGPVAGTESPLPLAIELKPLVEEGSRRRLEWREMAPHLPPLDWQLERAGPWPWFFPVGGGDQLLAKQLDRGLSLGELFLELHGQRFSAGVKVGRLLAEGVLRAVEPVGFTGSATVEPSAEDLERARLELEVADKLTGKGETPGTPVPEPEAATAATEPAGQDPRVLTEGLVRFRSGDLEGALEAFQRVLAADPMNELAALRLAEVEEARLLLARRRGLAKDRRLRLAVPISSLVGKKLSPVDSFLLSRLVEHPASIGDLVLLAPLTEMEVLEALERLLSQGILGDEMQPVRLRAEYRSAEETVEELTRTISKRQVTLETRNPLPVGSRFVFEISSPELPVALQITGVVAWLVEHGADKDGRTLFSMTVKYLFESEAEQERVEAAVDLLLRNPRPEPRRQFPRIPTAFRVAEQGSALRSTYTIRNLSQGGMMLDPDSPELGGETILTGTRVMLRIGAPGGPYGILGTVVWTAGRGKAGKGSMGVEFDAEARKVALDLMRRKLIPSSLSILFG